jgi:hypothetical protein
MHALAAKSVKALGYASVLVALFADTAQKRLSHFVVLQAQDNIGPCSRSSRDFLEKQCEVK